MLNVLKLLFSVWRAVKADKEELLLTNIAFRHQLLILQRQFKKPKSQPVDRLLWFFLSRYWLLWKNPLSFSGRKLLLAGKEQLSAFIGGGALVPKGDGLGLIRKWLNWTMTRQCRDQRKVRSKVK